MTPKSLITLQNTRLLYSFFGRRYRRAAATFLQVPVQVIDKKLQDGNPFSPLQLKRILSLKESRVKAVDEWRERKTRQYLESLERQSNSWKEHIERAAIIAHQTLAAQDQLAEQQVSEHAFVMTWRVARNKRDELYTILASQNLKQNKLAARRAEVLRTKEGLRPKP